MSFICLIYTLLLAVVCSSGNGAFLKSRSNTPNAPFSGRSDSVGVTMVSSILSIGGNTGNTNVNDIWRSDDSAVSWYQVGPFPVSVAQSAGVYFDSRCSISEYVVVYGGLVGTTTNSLSNQVWFSTNRGSTWTEVSTSRAWSPRYGHAVSRVAIAGQSSFWTVLVGGFNNGYFNDVYLLRGVNTGTWTKLADGLWQPRYGHSLTDFNQGSRLIMTGGKTLGNDVLLNDVWMAVFTSSNNLNWTMLTTAASFVPRIGCGIVTLHENLYVLAGAARYPWGFQGLNDVWISMDGGFTWTVVSSTANFPPRQAASYYLVGKELIVVGGVSSFPGGTRMNDIWSGFIA